jgi:hypothetical protein
MIPAKQHSTSPPSEDEGDEDEDEQENGNEDEDADKDEDSDEEDEEAHGGAAGEQGAGDSKSDVTVLLRTERWSAKSKGGRDSGQGSGTCQVRHVYVKSACGPKLND